MRFDALPVLTTERLILRPITMQDALDIFAYAQDPQVSKLLSWYPSTSIEETKKIINQWIFNYQRNKPAPWGIIDKASNRVIGTFDVHKYESSHRRAEIGYCLSSDYWGQGLMVEAVKCIIDYLFLYAKVTEVIAFCRIDNYQSQRVLEKAGMQKDILRRKRKNIKKIWVELDRYTIHKSGKGK